jgi:2-polyprenyl-3-methyl-5-hydroxy-6-metoxy-1,4-benzoquinol methylase
MTSEEIAAVVAEIRHRVRARYAKQVEDLPDFCLPSLTPLAQARDAAEGKVASIGTVNPRPPGLLNDLLQGVKRLVSRALHWHVREQVEFNRAVLNYMDRTLAAIEEQNRNLLTLARVSEAARRFGDFHTAWQQWREGWEDRWTKTEVQFLRTTAELQAAFQHRTTLLESAFREHVKSQHADYLSALERSSFDIQKRLWADLHTFTQECDRQIHTELRLIRQRLQAWETAAQSSAAPEAARTSAPPSGPPFDYSRFAERFRGSSEHVAAGQRFYLPYFQGRSRVLDVGCGRGEFLEVLREHGVAAQGVDSDAESVALCREKGLAVDQADLFVHLASLPDGSLGAIFSSQVVEHLPPARLPELVALAARKLEPGGLLAIETPNPECLAIFATNFYLDPTHVRPVPSALLHFYLQESGFGAIEVHQLAPAAEVFPEIAALGRVEGLGGFQQKFFGGLDYAILGRKL